MRSSRTPIDPNQPIQWQVVRQLWPYLLEFKGRVALALICLIAAKLASVALPFVLKHAVDSLNSESLSVQLMSVPIALVIAYGALRWLNVILGEVRDTLFGRVTERAMRRLGLRVFKHLHALDLAFHLSRQTGGLSRDIERGTSGIGFLMRFLIFNIVPTLLEIILVIGLLFNQYGFTFASVILASVITYVAFSVKATNWRTRYVREVNLADSTTNSRAIDSLLNFETVKYFSNEEFEANRYDEDLAQWEQARRNNRLSLFVLNAGQALIIAIAMTAMMLMAAYGVAEERMTIGDFVLINAFTMQLFMPLNFLGFVYREIRGSLANIENLFKLLRQQPAVTDEENAPPLAVSKGEVSFKSVGFHYQSNRTILEDVSFTVPAGSKVAVVGESGAGKSTLVKLLLRFYDPTHGEVCIDGQSIRSVSQHSLRQAIGIVPQDTVLFNDTLGENIRYGRPDASDDDIMHCIELAQLSQFVARLPEGLNTQVGERGLKLSGGEKQRVAIARALLKKPPILLFDEATSSLDSQSEASILDAIRKVSKGHTSLVIAHRLSTIVDADHIVVMAEGSVAEQGTHQQLLAQQGRYFALWQAQQHRNKELS